MKVVSDSSPICYLGLIGQMDLLPRMFGEVVVPEAVMNELSHSSSPVPLRSWLAQPPKWLTIQRVTIDPAPDLGRLHAGEREAIVLAQRLAADLLIIDEKAARRAARDRGLNVTGLLGILDEAATRGMLDLLAVVERLRQTNFRVSPNLLRVLLEKHFR